MKTIFLGEAANDSGKVGFSEAWPLQVNQLRCLLTIILLCLPSCPDCVYIHTLSDIDNELHICVVVVIGTSRNLCNIVLAIFFHPCS